MLKLLLVTGKITCKCLYSRIETVFRVLQKVFLKFFVHRYIFVLRYTFAKNFLSN